jgi:hypothetical protein
MSEKSSDSSSSSSSALTSLNRNGKRQRDNEQQDEEQFFTDYQKKVRKVTRSVQNVVGHTEPNLPTSLHIGNTHLQPLLTIDQVKQIKDKFEGLLPAANEQKDERTPQQAWQEVHEDIQVEGAITFAEHEKVLRSMFETANRALEPSQRNQWGRLSGFGLYSAAALVNDIFQLAKHASQAFPLHDRQKNLFMLLGHLDGSRLPLAALEFQIKAIVGCCEDLMEALQPCNFDFD